LDRPKIDAGDAVLMAGFPGGIYTELAPFVGGDAERHLGTYSPRPSVNVGLVTAIREYEGATRYQLDIRANPGNSGGPITNRSGEVVGILYAQMGALQSINYAIPVPYVLAILPRTSATTSSTPTSPCPGKPRIPRPPILRRLPRIRPLLLLIPSETSHA
jgi:S1-C subfamily serine protease